MRKLFPGHFRPKEEDFRQIWQECTFVFDANVLLNLYRYTPATREQLFEIFRQFQDRIWLPHQVVEEYFKNRLKAISEPSKVYDDIEQLFNSVVQKLGSFSKHPAIDFEKLSSIAKSSLTKAKKVLKDAKVKHPDLIAEDPILEQLADLFEGRIGTPYSQEKLDSIHKEAQARFEQNVPPGYKDSKKPEPYGDLILWFQLIEHAKNEKKPIVLVTNDVKEDWWLHYDSRILGPRPELVAEIQSKANVSFYMYRTERFIALALGFLGLNEQPAAIEEIREIQREEEEAEQLQQNFAVSLDQVPSILQGIQARSNAAATQSEAMKRFQQIAMPATTLSAEQVDAWKSSADSALQQYAQPATLAAQKYLIETFNQSEVLNRAAQLYAAPFAVDRKREQELSDLIKRYQQHQQELRDFIDQDRKRHEEWENQIARTYQSRLEAEARAQIKGYEEPTLAKARKQLEGYEQARVQAEAPQAIAQAGKGEQPLAAAQPRTEASQAMAQAEKGKQPLATAQPRTATPQAAQARKGEQPLAAAQPRTQTKKRKRQDEGDNTAQ